MLLLALLLNSPPADSARAAVNLARCEAALTTPAGTWTLQAWGPSEARARDALEDDAALLAELQRGGSLWADLFPLGEPEGVYAAMAMSPTPSAPLYVHAASLGEAACGPDDRSLRPKRSWQATWSAGEPETVVRVHPAHALEAARRRACLTPFRTRVLSAAFEMVMTPHDQHRARLTAAWTEASASLMDCWTASEAELIQSKRTAPPEEPGLYTCDALSPTPTGRPEPLGQGWGETSEQAAEQALRTGALSRYRASLGWGLYVHRNASDEQRASLTFKGLEAALLGLVRPTDALDRAALSCRHAPPGATSPMTWTPARPDQVRACGIKKGPEPASPASAAELPDAVDHTCGWWTDKMFTQLHEILVPDVIDSDGDNERLVVMHLETAYACSASCRSQATLDVGWTPAPLAGLPDRSSPEALMTLIDEAIAARDGERLLMAVRDPHLADRALSGGDAFWARVAEQHAAGTLREEMEVVAHHGLFMAMPAR
ncbi:MAG: hypothetical protein H6739_28935 [Alphaproteobacteria bacterium]|nr:hypothetical protein [Alphaproteobacteria bacterium]